MSKSSIALCFLALASCGKRPSPTSVPLDSISPARGPIVVTPSGAFAIYAHEFGAVHPWHTATADASWAHVAPCVGIATDRISRYPVWLMSAPREGENRPMVGCLHQFSIEGGGHIEIIGGSWDFDPANPGANPGPDREIARLWRHELVHLALGLRDGDIDGGHVRPEWACQFEEESR
jgi:hypothetical protein